MREKNTPSDNIPIHYLNVTFKVSTKTLTKLNYPLKTLILKAKLHGLHSLMRVRNLAFAFLNKKHSLIFFLKMTDISVLCHPLYST